MRDSSGTFNKKVQSPLDVERRMKGKGMGFRSIVFTAGIADVSIAAMILFCFRDRSAPSQLLLPAALGLGFLFLLASLLVVGRSARHFRVDFVARQEDHALLKSSLKELGGSPLKSLIVFFLLDVIYLVALFALGDTIGLRKDGRTPLFFSLLSVGMLDAAFVFVLSDKLCTKALLRQGLVRYPYDLRENRQQRKNFIIPTFMSIMTFVFAYSIASLASAGSGGSGGGISAAASYALVGVSLVFFAVIVVLVAIWTSGTALIYRSVIAQLERLSSAEKDLGKRISISSVDELGSISGMVNAFCVGLSESMSELKAAQGRLSDLGEKLRASADDSAGAVAQISANVGRVREKTRLQSASVAESSSAVEEIAKNIESLENLISDQAASVSEASASIEEMVGNIGSVTSSIDKMAEQFGVLLAAAEDGKTKQAESRLRVEKIAESSEALLEANNVIANIASQTNLLAMNAAIEAAHAGDAGRGFSVVADEIRRLAETSSRQSGTIRNELARVQESIQEVVASTRDAEQAFAEVAERIGDTDALVREVQHAMMEQKEGSSQVLEALKAMNDITSQVDIGSREMGSGNKMVLEAIVRLRDAAAEIEGSMNEMAVGAGEIAESSRKVSEMAKGTMETIRATDTAIGCFKTS
jgi:methyl-accepting chemotaxis protein